MKKSMPPNVPKITELKVRNFRALKSVDVKSITPMTVLLGPNGSGKTTIFDVFAFLSECFEGGLRGAWDKRGRMREIRTRGEDGPIEIEIKYTEPDFSPITYHLSVDERKGGPVVVEEWLRWTRDRGRPFKFLDYKNGQGKVISGERPDDKDDRVTLSLKSSDLLAVNALGQLADHPRVAALRDFITGWYVSYLSAEETRGPREAGPQERLSRTGDNLANVVQFLHEMHPDRLKRILSVLRSRVPQIEEVLADTMPDGRMLLRIRDAPFSSPILAKFASDGTMKMLSYLLVLFDPDPPAFIGIEEPENFLHPRLLRGLAEECRSATARTQLLVTTHSPFFVDGLRPKELRILWRDAGGYTRIKTANDIEGIPQLVEAGASLGELWMEGYFGIGDPLTNAGKPVHARFE